MEVKNSGDESSLPTLCLCFTGSLVNFTEMICLLYWDMVCTIERLKSSTGTRLIVSLQGIVQGRGGLILGSVIPCAMFYFLQFYLKRRRSPPPRER